jgi:hypothetical protein
VPGCAFSAHLTASFRDITLDLKPKKRPHMMEEQKPMDGNCCECGCECECCKKEKENKAKKANSNHDQTIFWHMRINDAIGSSFLGILAILLLVFLVRSNKRNRELLLEVISLRRQP